MKFATVVAVFALLGFSTEAARLNQKMFRSTLAEKDDIETHFSKFVSKFQRSYKNISEYNKRLEHFKQNKAFIDAENAMKGSYTLELNKFADLSNEEFQTMMGLVVPRDAKIRAEEEEEEEETENVEEALAETSQASSINWVTAGAVQSVRNQGSCGSCYAFSAIGTIESALYIKSKITLNLSEQQVVDCSTSYGN